MRVFFFVDVSFFDLNFDDDVVFEFDEDVFIMLKIMMGNNKNLKIGYININGFINKLFEI